MDFRVLVNTFFIWFGIFLSLQAQTNKDKKDWLTKMEEYKIKFSLGVQLWSTYTLNQEVYDQADGRYERVDNRFSTELRRSRLALSGQPYTFLKFNFVGSLDFVGRDVLSATQAGANNGASPIFRIWNAFVQWNLFPKADFLHVTMGYLPPQIGRESMTAALRVTSMAKAWTQNYLRRHLVGTAPGRAMGLNLGGLFFSKGSSVALSYDFGLFNPTYHSFLGNSVGVRTAPLFSGRIVLHLGDPEFSKYTIGHQVNSFNRRNGVSIGLAAARQGETEIFDDNTAVSLDWLINWTSLNIDGEWTLLDRSQRDLKTNVTTGYFRVSNNIPLAKDHILEPVFCVSGLKGPLDALEQRMAVRLRSFAGTDFIYSIGMNYYFNPDLRLSLNYSWQSADVGDARPGATFNNYLFQDGVGAIRRGNWLGTGIVAIF